MCIIHTFATIAIVSVMGIPVVVQSIEDEKARNSLTIILAGTASLCFAFFGVPVGPLVDGGVLKILGKNKDQYGKWKKRDASFSANGCLGKARANQHFAK